jgi:hypothetical protein
MHRFCKKLLFLRDTKTRNDNVTLHANSMVTNSHSHVFKILTTRKQDQIKEYANELSKLASERHLAL